MSQSRATFFALLAVLCWSTVATAFKLSLVHLSPLQLIFVASVSALVFFLVLLAWQRRLAELLQQDVPTYWRSFGFALLNPVLYYIVLFYTYSQLPAQEAQSLNYSWAIVLTLMAVPFLGHKLGRFDVLAAQRQSQSLWIGLRTLVQARTKCEALFMWTMKCCWLRSPEFDLLNGKVCRTYLGKSIICRFTTLSTIVASWKSLGLSSMANGV